MGNYNGRSAQFLLLPTICFPSSSSYNRPAAAEGVIILRFTPLGELFVKSLFDIGNCMADIRPPSLCLYRPPELHAYGKKEGFLS